MTSRSYWFATCSMATLMLFTSGVAQGQTEGPAEPADSSRFAGDIIVTAQKRSESIQDVPIAISAVSGDALQRSAINGLEGLQSSVPNLNIGQTSGAARIALRGVGSENLGTGAEGSIAFHVNGVFISRTAAALSSFYDIDRIEVLRGPQGTLYGRNATSGAINVITKKPTGESEGYFNLTLGSYQTLRAEGAFNVPIVADTINARVAFQTVNHDGYGHNIITGSDIDDSSTKSVRATIEVLPSDTSSIVLSADYHHEDDRNYVYHYFGTAGQDAAGNPITPVGVLAGGVLPSRIQDVAHAKDPRNQREFWGVSADVKLDVGFAELRSLTAYRETNYFTRTDLDQTSAVIAEPFSQREDAKQFSQELQLTGDGDRFRWLIGGYYFYEQNDARQVLPISTFSLGAPLAVAYLTQGLETVGPLDTKAAAAFGQLTYEVIDDLSLTLGARYSWEEKKVDNTLQIDFATPYDPNNPLVPLARLQDTTSFKDFTPRIGVDYKINRDMLLYASFSQGFKSGTYNLGLIQPPLNPEKITAYEAGLKTTLAGGVGRVNVAGFYYDYTDLQVGKVINNFLGLENAATARIYGVEVESWFNPATNFELNATFSWLNARFKNYISVDPARPAGDGVTTDENGVPAFDLSGKALSQAPDFSASAGAHYRFDLGEYFLRVRGEVSWKDRIYFSPFNVREVSESPSTKGNVFVTIGDADERWSLTAFAKNLGRRTIQNAYVNTALVGFTVTGGLDEPELYGLTGRFNF